jgi:transcriptional regulator with XRE-family HTH domain
VNEPLRRALLRARLREDDVAAHLGVDPKTVRRWLNGRTPYPHNRAAIAELADVDEAELWPDAGGLLAARVRPEELGDGLPAPVGCSAGGLGSAIRISRARDRHPRLQRAVPRRRHGNPSNSG